METVASAPAWGAVTSQPSASDAGCPSATALLNALVAGASASTIVLSPSLAAPSCWIPASAASSAAARAGRSTSAASPSDLPARRKAVPYSGPDAPPTLEISVRPVSVRTAPGVAGWSASSAATAAVKPRARLVPWSASPMAASSWVRWSRCSVTTAMMSVIQARKTSASMVSPPGRAQVSVRTPSASPAKPRCVHRRVPQPGQVVGELGDRDREALHVQAGDVVANQVPGHPGTLALDVPLDLGEHDVELDQRGAAHAVDHDQQVAGQRHVVADGVEHVTGQVAGGGDRGPFPAGLAVDADAQLDLGLGQLEVWLAHGRKGDRGQRDAERAGPLVDLTGHRGHVGQRGAALSRGPGDLLHEHRGPDPAAARRVQRVLDGHVVVDHDREH